MYAYALRIHKDKYLDVCTKHNFRSNTEEMLIILSCIHNPSHYDFYICKNMFLAEPLKGVVSDMYVTAKTMNRRIKKCIRAYRYRKIKPCNETDLSCVPFTEYKKTEYFDLVDKGQKYLFKHSDMYNLIEASLTNTVDTIISSPVDIKNPYTGVPFTTNQLYVLYTRLKHLPPFFDYFVKCECKLDEFLLNYECLLRTHIIKKTLKEFSEDKKREEIRSMLGNVTIYDANTGMYIPIIQPDEIHGDLLKLAPFLLFFYNYQYSLNPYQRTNDYKRLIRKLLQLRETADFFILLS